MIDKLHRILIEALESRSYVRLRVKRYGSMCYLVISLAREEHVFVDKAGKQVAYRHAWQARRWLKQRFAIPEIEVEVEIVR